MKTTKKIFKLTLALVALMCLTACGNSRIPNGVNPVRSFDAKRYIGKWYEIARLDHSFERGMSQVTAEYFDNGDGSIKVINRGFSEKKNKWSEVVGRAKFVGASDIGHLKVSFFGPFYGGYIVFELDPVDYQYALISGPNHSYLWLLSRTPTINDHLRNYLIQQAKSAGFDTSQLIDVKQR